jgi:hypothetical protein
VNELPASTLQSKHAGHADHYGCHVLSNPTFARPRSTSTMQASVSETYSAISFDLDDLAVAVVGGSASKCLLHFLPAAYVGTKRVSQGHIVCLRIQRLVDARVTVEDRAEGRVALLGRVGKVACRHPTVPPVLRVAQGMRCRSRAPESA